MSELAWASLAVLAAIVLSAAVVDFALRSGRHEAAPSALGAIAKPFLLLFRTVRAIADAAAKGSLAIYRAPLTRLWIGLLLFLHSTDLWHAQRHTAAAAVLLLAAESLVAALRRSQGPETKA